MDTEIFFDIEASKLSPNLVLLEVWRITKCDQLKYGDCNKSDLFSLIDFISDYNSWRKAWILKLISSLHFFFSVFKNRGCRAIERFLLIILSCAWTNENLKISFPIAQTSKIYSHITCPAPKSQDLALFQQPE